MISSDLQPPDRRRELVRLATACMAIAYPLYAVDRLDPHRLQHDITEAFITVVNLIELIEDFPWIGLTVVSICGVAVFAIRLRKARREAERCMAELEATNKELERLQSNVERMVALRTAELEKANRSLAAAFRDKAATLAEMAVLEERSRIAHEIHDVVGHTLTAAIVQLEATKRIAERQQSVPQDKLELLSGLVKKGLDDIRCAVKLMGADDKRTLTLEEELRELIHYTEKAMEIAIEADISISGKHELGRWTEQALYYALLEGLTNGIRHGKCKRVRFSLRAADGKVRFRLISDGKPYGSAAPGFGLSSLIERVKQLRGSVDVRSAVDTCGNPVGCTLSIDLPLAG